MRVAYVQYQWVQSPGQDARRENGSRTIPIAQFDSFVVRLIGLSKCRSKLRMRRAGAILSAKVLLDLSVNAMAVAVALPARGQWLTHSFFTLNWIIVSVVIGLLVALIGAFLYPHATTIKLPAMSARRFPPPHSVDAGDHAARQICSRCAAS